MRMSWFTSLRAGRRLKGKRQKLKAAPLRVRQLERRRVLDAAVSSVVVSTVVVADAGQGQPPPAATTTNATDAPPIVAPVQSPAENSSNATAHVASLGPAQGLGANVPPVLNVQLNQTVNEGQLLDLSGTGGAPPIGIFVDTDAGDTHTATVDWGDGSPTQNLTIFNAFPAFVLGGSHVYADDGTYTVTVTAADNNGGSDTKSFDVLVKNVAPFVDLTGPTSVNEGAVNNWTLGPVVDPGTDTVTQYAIHWGDGNTDTFTAAQIAGMGNTVSHAYADGPNNYSISVDLVDEDGSYSAVDTLNVTVNNVAPFVDLTGPTTVDEGSPNNWNLGPVVDPGTDTVTQYVIHWGDGNTDTFTPAQIAGMGNAVGHTYSDGPNNYTIAVDLVDEDGTFSSVDTLNVTVNNVSPFVDLTGPTTVNEGASNNWNLGPVVDPGSDTVTQYVIHWGDGNTNSFTAAQIAGMSGAVGHTYADGPNNYTIAVDLVDEDGTHLAVDTLAVTVNNVPPVVDITGPTVVNEGAPNNWMLGAVVDPGTDTVSQYVIHWGDGNTDTFTAAQIAGMSNTIGHTYADGPNNYTISVDLVDEDGTYSAVDTLDVTVNNVSPFVDLTGPTSVNEGAPNSWNLGPVVDPGTDTVTQYVIHWGDGNTDTFTAAQIAGMSNTIGHTYADGPNNYTISVDLVDEDGTFSTVDTLNVAVNNVAPFVDLTGPTTVNEGAPNNWNLGPVVDPGTDTVSQYVIHWGDGNADTFTAAQIAGMGNVIGHTYADGPGNFTIAVDLVDEDGTYLAEDTLSVSVNNVIPVLTTVGNQTVDEGTPLTITNLGQVSDPGFKDVLLGTDETFRFSINWGDSTAPT